MGSLWAQFVALVQLALTSAAAVSGGSAGVGILMVSLSLRLALFPLTLRMARRAEAQRRILEWLKPKLEDLNERFANDPRALGERTIALYREHGVTPVEGGTVAAMLVQLPLVSALYSAICSGFGAGQRFLWIADLAKPDFALVAITGALTYVTSQLGPPQAVRSAMSVLGAVITIALMWRVSAALGLYWATSTAVGAAQAAWMRARPA